MIAPKKRSPRPAACTACGVTLRPKRTVAVPGTRMHVGRGLCSRCWKRDVYGHRPRPGRPPACTSCRRGWDEVKHGARGLCTVCYSAQKYRAAHELVRQPMPASCNACKRPLRRVGTPKVPGTVTFAGSGMCGSCFNAAKAGRRVTPLVTPSECAGCHRPMRTKAKAGPEHVVHAARGLCATCYTAAAARERALLAYVLGRGP